VESARLLPCSRCRRLKIRCKERYSGDHSDLDTFLEVRRNIAKLDFRIQDSREILYFAAREGHLGLLEALLDIGVQVEEESEFGYTALSCAATYGTKSIAKALIVRGANVNHVAESRVGAANAILARTPLFSVLFRIAEEEMQYRQGLRPGGSRQSHYIEVACMLIDAGADLEHLFQIYNWKTNTIDTVGTMREVINKLIELKLFWRDVVGM